MSADLPPLQPSDLLAAAEREVRFRERVYPRWVDAGRMVQAKADHEIRCMKAIVEALRPGAEASRLL